MEWDLYQAMEYFQQAAGLGVAEAWWYIGSYYEEGLVVVKDYKTAREMYTKGGEAGDPDCWMSLAYCYATGKGMERSFEQALPWYEKAATWPAITSDTSI